MTELARVCVACRTAYAAGGACDGGAGHDALALDDPAQRARLIEAVWGDEVIRRFTLGRIRGQEDRGTWLVLGGGLIGLTIGIVAMPFVAYVGAMGGGAVGGIVAQLVRRRPPSEHPIGAVGRVWPRASGRGRVRGAGVDESPASGEPCAAWSLELRYDGVWGERVMLRAGASAGLEIALDGGETMRIAAGPIVLAETAQQVDDLAVARIAALVKQLDPLGGSGEPFPALPHNVVAEAMLFVGDRVEILGELDRVVVAATAGGELYRDAPASRLTPRGVPILRRC